MYIVTIKNGTNTITVHDEERKLSSGKVVKGINAIDSFSFSVLPSNVCFDNLYDLTTLIDVYNTTKNRYEFNGRVLYSEEGMSENGAITKDVVCESYLGFLCDSWQTYIGETEWSASGLLRYLIAHHNSQVESYKRFEIGEIDVSGTVTCTISRKSTWETINEALIKNLGGEIRYRIEGDVTYIDYLKQIGIVSTTEIALSKNMKSVSRERDPSEIVTRLIPLGAKIGENSEERLDITSVNGGKNYIEDTAALELYGIRYKIVEFDNTTVARNLLIDGQEWLAESNKVAVKYTVTALDLSLLGLEIDDFDVYNYYPIKNVLLGIDDTARIIKKTIDICEEVKSSFDIGENFETLSDIQIKQFARIAEIEKSNSETEDKISEAEKDVKEVKTELEEQQKVITTLEANDGTILAKVEAAETNISYLEIAQNSIIASVSYNENAIASLEITQNQILSTVSDNTNALSRIEQRVDAIEMSVGDGVTEAELALTIQNGVAKLSGYANSIEFKSNTFYLDSDYMTITKKGGLTCQYATLNEAYVTSVGTGGTLTLDGGWMKIVNGGAFIQVGAATTSAGKTRGYIRGGTSTGNGLFFYEDGIKADGAVYANASIATTSDANKKNSIMDISESYSLLFDNLTPRLYKYNDGTSDRTHVGFIAQEVEDAITAAGLSSQDFAGFIRSTEQNEYYLRYEEFIALCVKEIQTLKKEMELIKHG